MQRIVQSVALIALVGLLAAILFVLVDVARNGIHIVIDGRVDVTGMNDQMALTMVEPVTLVMDEATRLTISGPDGGALPTSLSLVSCPVCSASMLPVRWSPWSGEIDWVCPVCGEALSRAPAAP